MHINIVQKPAAPRSADPVIRDLEDRLVRARIRLMADRYGVQLAREKGKRPGTQVFANLAATYAGIEENRLDFLWHVGGHKPDFMEGVEDER